MIGLFLCVWGALPPPEAREQAAAIELPSLAVGDYFAGGPFARPQRLLAGGATKAGVELLRKTIQLNARAPLRSPRRATF